MGKGGEILHRIAAIDFSSVHPALKDTRFTIACDVRNPFCGPEGAAHVFARQKGADDTMIEKLDVGMQSFSRLIHSTTGREITHDFFHGKRSQISDGPFPAGFEVKSTRRILFCHA